MMIRSAARAWLRNRALADEWGLALGLGGMLKLIYLRNFDVVLATLVVIVMIDFMIAGRAVLGTLHLPHYPKSVGLRPALAIIAVASVLLLLPLGDAGCVVIAAAGIVIGIVPRISSLTR